MSLRRPRDTPRTRYLTALRRGEAPPMALATVAESYGLEITTIRADGLPKPIEWTLRDVERLLWIRWLVENGRIVG